MHSIADSVLYDIYNRNEGILLFAVNTKNYHKVETILESDLSINIKNAFVQSLNNNDFDMAEILLNNINNQSILSLFKEDILHKAVNQCSHNIVELLLKKNLFLIDKTNNSNKNLYLKDVPNSYEETLLYIAVSNNDLDMVKLLLKYDCTLNIPSSFQETILHKAVNQKSYDILEQLLEKDLCLKHITNNSEKALYLKDVLNTAGETPLYRAVSNNDLDMVDLLLKYKADVRIACSHNLNTPLDKAIMIGCKDIIKNLIKHKAFVNEHKINDSKDDQKNTLLHRIVINEEFTYDERFSIAKQLLAGGSDPYKSNKDNKTPIDLAYDNDDYNLAELLETFCKI